MTEQVCECGCPKSRHTGPEWTMWGPNHKAGNACEVPGHCSVFSGKRSGWGGAEIAAMREATEQKKAKAAARKARRVQKAVENAALRGEQAANPGGHGANSAGNDAGHETSVTNAVAGRFRSKPTKKSQVGKKRRKKSPTLSKLKKLLWEEIRQVVYSWSPNYCQACGEESAPVACHIVPAGQGASTQFFLPNIYRGCHSCNGAERRQRVTWVGKHEDIFGKDYVDALREMSRGIFDLDKAWVLEQTERMKKLRAA